MNFFQLRLSPHFTLREFCRSSTADRLGIDNCPTDKNEADPGVIVERLRWIANEICEPIRNEFGPFSPNSGYRCLDLNRALRSGDRSRHRMGAAVDLEHPRVDNRELAMWIDEHCPGAHYILLEFYRPTEPASGWVHVEAWPNNDVPEECQRKFRCARMVGGAFYCGH